MNKEHKIIIVIIIALILVVLYFHKKHNKVGNESFRFRRGYPLDDFCLTYDCTTETGKAAAIKACGDKVEEEAKKDPRCRSSDPNVFKYCKYINCFSNDPLIRANGCPFDCDINNVVFMSNTSSSVSQCVKDVQGNLTLGSDDTGNYCVNEMGSWIHFPPTVNGTPIYKFNDDGTFQDSIGNKYDKNGKLIK